MERQRKLAETLREKVTRPLSMLSHFTASLTTVTSQADAEDRGEDAERRKNWEWTIEENDAWEKKLKRKARRADFEFHGTFIPPFP
jgi:pre-mRNA-splicing factor SYF2